MSRIVPLNPDAPIGSQLRQLREKRGLSMLQVAESMKVEVWQVVEIEQTTDKELKMEVMRDYISAIGGRLTSRANRSGEISLDS